MTSIPTTEQNISTSLATLESKLNQNSPLLDRAFLQVMSGLQGMTKTELYQFGIERAQQVLALNASEEDLDDIAKNYGITRKPAVTAVLTISVSGVNTTPVRITTTWIGQVNSIRYFQETAAVIGASPVPVDIYAEQAGVVGNMQVGDLVEIGATNPGIDPTATVSAIVTEGANKETDDELRIRILNEIQTVGGGSNLADIRSWGEEATNVKRCDPYTGRPPFSTSEPGYRTVFVEATESFDPDGIPSQPILDDVRDKITTDPDTGKARQALGSTDDTLGVEPITRILFYFTVAGLTVDPARLSDAQTDIDTALKEYARSLYPFIDGLDSEVFKNNVITSVAASNIVADVLKKYAGHAQAVNFGLSPGIFLPEYELNPGERAKGTVDFD
jgi:uncharacterized phage protein gp47/JayE